MEYKNQTYYWILPLNEGKWTLAKHIEGTWHFIDGRCRLTNDLGQTGEEIFSNDELFNQRRMHEELMGALKECSRFNKAVVKVDGTIDGGENEFYEHYKKIEQLLKQAEQK